MHGKEEEEFAAFVGIDWADQQHAWTLQTGSGVEHGTLKHTPEAVDAWVTQLGQRFGERRIAVALEQSRGALFFMLTKYSHLVLFSVHPSTMASYRHGFRPSGAKSDPSDADLILELLVKHRTKLRRLNPDTTETRTLQFLAEQRRQFVDEKTRCSNRLTAYLKLYFPQALDWFNDIDSEIAGAFLERWPTLAILQKAAEATVRNFLTQRRGRATNDRLKNIAHATAATRDEAVISSCSMAVVGLVRMMRQLREIIGSYDEQIDKLARAHPDFAIFVSLPGAGKALVPRLIAAFGTQRDRFRDVNDLQAYSGIAPVVASSGKACWVHWRWSCSKFVRQTFHEWARISIRYCDWAKDYYDRQRAKGKSAHIAYRSLAFKWIRIVYRCWVDRKPYQQEVYRQALARRSKPTMKEGAVKIQWKNEAGFSKIAGLTLE
jgi:transposase